MKTKLVYVLTCAPEATYIEQALMAVWSARHWNPDAHIVLLTDNLTNELLVGKRGELLNYISEKIVIPFDDDKNMHYRSRWIKTSVRQLIQGDFLFVDCDTICCKSLSSVDDFTCEIGAVGDNNTPFQLDRYKKDTEKIVMKINCDISKEQYYFSSGVVYCKDTENVHRFYSLWHQYWKEGVVSANISLDQPAMAKADIELNHIIVSLPNEYNNVIYTQNPTLSDSYILHICGHGPFLFFKSSLKYLQNNGLSSWVSDRILNIHSTYLPFDYYIKHSSYSLRWKWLKEVPKSIKYYHKYCNKYFDEWQLKISTKSLVFCFFKMHCYHLGFAIWLLSRRVSLRNKKMSPNTCSI